MLGRNANSLPLDRDTRKNVFEFLDVGDLYRCIAVCRKRRTKDNTFSRDAFERIKRWRQTHQMMHFYVPLYKNMTSVYAVVHKRHPSTCNENRALCHHVEMMPIGASDTEIYRYKRRLLQEHIDHIENNRLYPLCFCSKNVRYSYQMAADFRDVIEIERYLTSRRNETNWNLQRCVFCRKESEGVIAVNKQSLLKVRPNYIRNDSSRILGGVVSSTYNVSVSPYGSSKQLVALLNLFKPQVVYHIYKSSKTSQEIYAQTILLLGEKRLHICYDCCSADICTRRDNLMSLLA